MKKMGLAQKDKCKSTHFLFKIKKLKVKRQKSAIQLLPFYFKFFDESCWARTSDPKITYHTDFRQPPKIPAL